MNDRSSTESRFDRGAWLTLAVVVGWIAFTIGVTLWAKQYPQDGWTQNGPLDPDGHYEVESNIAGVPSPLQGGDRIVAINGQPLVNGEFPPLPPNLQVGQVLQYTIQRGGETRTVDVQLVQPDAWVVVRGFVERWRDNPRDFVVALVSFLVVAFAFFVRPGNLGARYLMLFYGFYFAVICFGFASSGLYVYSFAPAAQFVYSFVPSAWAWYFFPTLILLALSFPVVKAPLRRFPRLLPALLYGVPFVVSAAAYYLVVTTRDRRWEEAIMPLFLFISVLAVISIFGSLIHNWFTVKDAVSRAQLRWVTLGMGGGLGLTFLFFTVIVVLFGQAGSDTAWVLWLMLVLPICLAIAITRYRLFDIDIIIRRTLTYGLITGALLLVFFGSVIILQQLFSALTGSSQNELVTVLSTLALAVLFVPVRNRIQGAIDQRFNRRKYDAQKVLAQFALAARDETDLEKLTGRLIEAVDETMQPASATVWLKDMRRGTPHAQ